MTKEEETITLAGDGESFPENAEVVVDTQEPKITKDVLDYLTHLMSRTGRMVPADHQISAQQRFGWISQRSRYNRRRRR